MTFRPERRTFQVKAAAFTLRLLAPYLLALLAVGAGILSWSNAEIEKLYLDVLSENVLRQARLAGQHLPWNVQGNRLDRECAQIALHLGARVTVIAPDGMVLGDSEAPSTGLENHAHLPEVIEALQSGDGAHIRVIAGTNRALFYRAWLQTRGADRRVVRLAVPRATIEGTRSGIQRALLVGLTLAAIAVLIPNWLLLRRLATRVARLAALSDEATGTGASPRSSAEREDFIGRIEADVAAMAAALRSQLRAAREEKEQLEAVLRGMVEGVLVVGKDGRIRLANQRACEIFGVPTGDLSGRRLIELSRDPELLALVEACETAPQENPFVREITLAAKQETLQVTGATIATPEERERRLILVFHDITRLKKLETTRRDFVANVSHELRTPLAAIRGYAETLLRGALHDPENAQRFIAIIERHAERMGRLVDDLLTLSDLEFGRTEIEREPLDIAPLIEWAIETFRIKAADAGIDLRQDVEDRLPEVYAATDRVQQILLNLIDNAIKYTPPGGKVTVYARRVIEPNLPEAVPAMELGVEDTGIGIPSQDLPRITERFYRIDKVRSRELGGTGLGLAIVKHIVQAHGGRLEIESEFGAGTRVRVFLPLADST